MNRDHHLQREGERSVRGVGSVELATDVRSELVEIWAHMRCCIDSMDALTLRAGKRLDVPEDALVRSVCDPGCRASLLRRILEEDCLLSLSTIPR